MPRSRSVARASAGVAAGVIAAVALLSPATNAHKAITSPYNYNEHVYPILRERCGRCHFEGGPTPMSLTSYKDAVPWAESIREQLVGEKMPPWYPDLTGPAVKAGHHLPTRELDVLVTWAVGGTPLGEIGKDPAPFVPVVGWPAGEPDVKIPMPTEHTLPAGTMEDTKEFVLPTGFTEATWIKAADLMPGLPSMVRDAVIAVENGPVLAAWVPGDDATPAPSGAAFRVAAGAKLTLRIHYKKHWQDEQESRSDKSVVGLYLTDAPVSGRELQSVAVTPAASPAADETTFSSALKAAARIVAIRPSFDRAYATFDVRAVLAGGRTVPLVLLRSPQPQWYRRYWLAEPIELPAGAKIEIVATAAPKDDFAAAVVSRYPLQVSLDYVAP
jgi:hypothetical protein